MHKVAVRVAENLDFDMARPAHQFFEIDLVLAKGALCLPLGAHYGIEKLVLALDWPHAAAAAAPGGLEHERVADIAREALHFPRIVRQGRCCGHDRYATGNCYIARRYLVAEIAHGLRTRADEDNTRRSASVREFWTLGKKAVTGMDRVGLGFLGDPDHLFDR